jgi:hypothetical protein
MTTRTLAAAFAFVLLAGSAAAVPAAAGAPVEGDALAARVATMVGADSKGILGMSTESTQKISAPIMHKQTAVRRYVVFQDGIPVAAGITSVVEDGKPYDAAKLAQMTSETDTKIKHGEGFNHQPYVSKFVREYHFASAPCDGCAPGERGLKFDTDLHDDVHIAGLMVVDASDRPVRVTSHPYQYPSPASSGESTTTFGAALGAHRLPVDVHGLYFGHKGFIRGSFTFDEHNSFQRYASVAEAVAALSH